MKSIFNSVMLAMVLMTLLIGCGTDYSGTYTGYSWKDESKGIALDDAKQKIETTLVLDRKGIIREATVDFMKLGSDGTWYLRNDPEAVVVVDFSVIPSLATPQSDDQDYAAGASMFSIDTHDKMSFYTVAVDDNATVAFGLVDPIHRYLSELRLDGNFDYSRPVSDLTIANGLLVPTVRASGSGSLKPKSWDPYLDTHLFGFYSSPYVYTARGTFAGISPNSSIQELLEKAGVIFDGGTPEAMAPTYGFYATGGWTGNYLTVAKYLVGKDAAEVTSLVDWSVPRYAAGVNGDNFFGIDVVSGATKTAQNSTDGIAGATVRMSRESTSYQRALVKSGIISEEDVIKGRF